MRALSPQQLNAPLHILLIEDDEGDRDLALAYLTENTSHSYQVTWANSLKAGLNKLSTTRFDAIILDLVLPDSRGVATVSKLCAHSQGTPVIVSSYFDEDALANKVIELGAQDYLAKDQMDSQTLGRSLTRSLARAKHQTAQISTANKDTRNPLVNNKVKQLQADILRLEEIASDINQIAAKEKALEAMRQRTVTTLSHECRTPATVLLLATNILKSYTEQIENPQYLSTIVRMEEAVKQLMQLLDNARVFKQTQSLSTTNRPECFNLEQLCQEIITKGTTNHSTKAQITDKYSGDCQNVFYYKTVVENVLQQILTNAIIYSPESAKITIAVQNNNQQIHLKVQDWGCGIPTDEQSQIFEAFYRASYVDNIHGLGLGLTIVKTCVDMCGGTIDIHSQQNEGTTVTVILPEIESPSS